MEKPTVFLVAISQAINRDLLGHTNATIAETIRSAVGHAKNLPVYMLKLGKEFPKARPEEQIVAEALTWLMNFEPTGTWWHGTLILEDGAGGFCACPASEGSPENFVEFLRFANFTPCIVAVSSENRAAMSEALKAADISIVDTITMARNTTFIPAHN